jgi:two-component system NtrC family sensor kinase
MNANHRHSAGPRAIRAADGIHARIGDFIEFAPDAMMIVNRAGEIVLVNGQLERLFGYRRQELLGTSFELLVPERFRTAHAGHYVTYSAGPWTRPMGAGLELYGRRKNATEFPVEISLNPMESDEGPLIVAAIRDVTEQKRLRDELATQFRQAREAGRESEERFRKGFEGSAVAMSLQGLDGRYLRVNPALCEMLGYSEAELLGMVSHDVLHPDDRHVSREQDLRVIADEIPSHQIEQRYLHRLGHSIWVLTSVSSVRDVEGRPAHFIVQSQDLTKRKRAEEELARQRERLAQAEKLASMGELLAGVAHELNNPLAVVLGRAGLLEAQLRDHPASHAATKIVTAAERCARIVKNFMALARQQPTAREVVDLSRVVSEAIELLAYSLRVDGIDLDLRLAPALPPLWADPHQLHQVVVNLVSNAHHALRETVQPRRITIATGTDSTNSTLVLEVGDSGPGIPPEIEARIFEPFFTTKSPGQGTGLGLPICRGIVESHGGTLSLEQGREVATVFRVVLPVTRASPVPEPATAVQNLPPLRVLVVDDELDVAGMLVEMLMEEGHSVDVAENGRIALQRVAEERYDLVLSDLRMPELDGIGLYQAIEARFPQLAPKVIFLTGDALNPNMIDFVTSRVSVAKPFVLDDIRRAIQRVLRQ